MTQCVIKVYDAEPEDVEAIFKFKNVYQKKTFLTYIDTRIVSSLEELRSNKDSMETYGHDWFKSGTNHREEGGYIKRNVIEEDKYIFAEFSTLDDLKEFIDTVESAVIETSDYLGFTFDIKI